MGTATSSASFPIGKPPSVAGIDIEPSKLLALLRVCQGPLAGALRTPGLQSRA
jgi:hypothetical protein